MSSYYKYISNRPAHDPRKCRRHFHLAACRFRSANIRLPQIGLLKSDRLLGLRQRIIPGHPIDRRQQLIAIERLQQDCVGAKSLSKLQTVGCRKMVTPSGNRQNSNRWLHPFQFRDDLKTVSIGHNHVGDDQIDHGRSKQSGDVVAARRTHDVATAIAQPMFNQALNFNDIIRHHHGEWLGTNAKIGVGSDHPVLNGQSILDQFAAIHFQISHPLRRKKS